MKIIKKAGAIGVLGDRRWNSTLFNPFKSSSLRLPRPYRYYRDLASNRSKKVREGTNILTQYGCGVWKEGRNWQYRLWMQKPSFIFKPTAAPYNLLNFDLSKEEPEKFISPQIIESTSTYSLPSGQSSEPGNDVTRKHQLSLSPSPSLSSKKNR